jgi:PTH1 family peptidyl-tRNA hydrolase
VKVVVGLRNPGDRYEGTRHNVGHEVVSLVADRHGVSFGRGPLRTRCRLAEVRLDGERVALAAPNSYMNESGGPVGNLLAYFKVGVEDLLVVHDDIDLPFARLRLHAGRGSGGHNGIRSIESRLGTNEFARLKVGVGRPPGRMDPAAYVLARFGQEERVEVDMLVEDAADVVERWITDPDQAAELAAQRRPPD